MTLPDRQRTIMAMLGIPLLVAAGFFFLSAALWRDFGEYLDEAIGRMNLVYLGAGFLFLYTAVLVADKNRLRRQFIEVLAGIQDYYLGEGHRHKIDSMDILLTTLKKGSGEGVRTAVNELKRLTGQDFGRDASLWEAWWTAHREQYVLGKKTFPGKHSPKSED